MNVQVFSLTVAVCLSLLITPPCAGSGQVSTTVPDAAVIASNAFAMDLYAALRKQEGNLFFSPANIACTLAMAEAGARGKTAQEIRDVLHMPDDSLAMHKAFGALGKSAPGGILLYSANAIWSPEPIQLLEPFQTIMERAYGVNSVMTPNPGDSREYHIQINEWIAKETNNRITEAIRFEDLPPGGLSLSLVSASYMNGQWRAQFPRQRTETAPFTTASGETVEVPTMHMDDFLEYGEKENCQVLEMSYQNSVMAMILVLPKEPDGLPALEKELTQIEVNAWLPKMQPVMAIVSLPRFRFTSDLHLGNVLGKMGMPTAFSDKADFKNMMSIDGLQLKLAKHCSWVDVNEEGTEAASATVMGIGMPGMVDESVDFIADHPFLFFIQDRKSGLIHYVGRVLDPLQK